MPENFASNAFAIFSASDRSIVAAEVSAGAVMVSASNDAGAVI